MKEISSAMSEVDDQSTNDTKNAVAMGLQPGSPEFMQYIKDATISKANVHNYGPKLEPGYRWLEGKEGMESEPTPGSKAEFEREKAVADQEQMKVASKRNWRNVVHSSDRMKGTIQQAMDQNSIFTQGPIGQVLGKIAGTPAADMRATLTTIKANIGFDRLQQMRAASVSGGALGNVSNREIELLYNSLQPLGGEDSQGREKAAMSPAQMEKSLQTILGVYERLSEYARNADMFDAMSDEEYHAHWDAKGLAPVYGGTSGKPKEKSGTWSEFKGQ